MNEPILSVKALQLSYGVQDVLKNISFDILPGEIVGYLGANGAGKSTTIKTILGLNETYRGEIEVFSENIKMADSSYKNKIGYVPEKAVMYDELTPCEYLGFVGTLYGLNEEFSQKRALELLTLLDMEKFFHQRIDSFSKGMRQKVLIVSSLLHNPDILFLDEPLNGLDVMSVAMIKAILGGLAAQGKVIFFSSHILEVVQSVANRILILEDGEIVADRLVATIEGDIALLFGEKLALSTQARATHFVEVVMGFNWVGQTDV